MTSLATPPREVDEVEVAAQELIDEIIAENRPESAPLPVSDPGTTPAVAAPKLPSAGIPTEHLQQAAVRAAKIPRSPEEVLRERIRKGGQTIRPEDIETYKRNARLSGGDRKRGLERLVPGPKIPSNQEIGERIWMFRNGTMGAMGGLVAGRHKSRTEYQQFNLVLDQAFENPESLFPFAAGVRPAINTIRAYQAAKSLEAGTITGEEKYFLEKWIRDEARNQSEFGNLGFGGGVANILAQMPAFIGEFVLTGGVYRATKTAANKAILLSAEKLVRRHTQNATVRGAARMARQTVGTVAGGAAQGVALGTRTAETFARKQWQELAFDRDDDGNLVVLPYAIGIDGKPRARRHWSRNLLNAQLDTMIEAVSERSGAALGVIFSRMPLSRQRRALNDLLFARWTRKGAGRTRAAFNKAADAVGYNGIVGEVFEERVGDVGRWAAGLEPMHFPTGEELLAEFVAFALLPGAVMTTTQATLMGRQFINEQKQKRTMRRYDEAAAADVAEEDAGKSKLVEDEEAEAAAGEVIEQVEQEETAAAAAAQEPDPVAAAAQETIDEITAQESPDVSPQVPQQAEEPVAQVEAVEPAATEAQPAAEEAAAAEVAAPKKPWQMTYDDLLAAVTPSSAEELEASRPVLAEMYADYLADPFHRTADPWGIVRAVERGGETPRTPTFDLSVRHRRAITQAIEAGETIPPEVLAQYPDIQPAEEPSDASQVPEDEGEVQEGGPVRQGGEGEVGEDIQFAEGARPAAGDEGAQGVGPIEQFRAESQEAQKANRPITTFMDEQADKARARMNKRGFRLKAGLDPADLADLSIIGAARITKGISKLADWSAEMVKEFGEAIRPHLDSVFAASRELHDSQLKQYAQTPTPAPAAAPKPAKPTIPTEEPPSGAQPEPARPAGAEPGPGGVQPARPELPGPKPDLDTGAGGVAAPVPGAPRPAGEAGGARPGGDRGGRTGEGPGGEAPQPGVGPVRGPTGGVPPGGAEVRPEPAGPGEPGTTGSADTSDWRITDPKDIIPGGPKTKARQNIAAITLTKQLQDEGRTATPAEQAIIAKFAGWGDLKPIFDRYSREERWVDERKQVADVLTEDEWLAARDSTLNAHFTSGEVIGAMWRAAQRMGIETAGGISGQARIGEPGMGIGYFFGLMPQSLKNAKKVGIEMDTLTGQMAKQLYPNASIHIDGFQHVPLPDNYFDMWIGNWPFADVTITADPRYAKMKPVVHDYFWLKTIDTVRPGGVVMAITSTGTMDKISPEVRKAISAKADLVAAIRLPGGAFQKSAGTQVVTDLLIFRKRLPGEAAAGPKWESLAAWPVEGKEALAVNEYWRAHPDNILGTMNRSGTQYGPDEMGVTADPNWFEKLNDVVESLPPGIIQPRQISRTPWEPVKLLTADEDAPRENGLFIKGDKLYQRHGPDLIQNKVEPGQLRRIKGLLGVRDEALSVISAERLGAEEEDVKQARAQLNAVYDAFVKKRGPLNDDKNYKALLGDPDVPLLRSLEIKTKDGWAKADIFTKRTIRSAAKVERSANVTDAMVVSLDETGHVDPPRMAELTGKSVEQVESEMRSKGLAFEDPEAQWELPDLYLSGNVKKKLAAARAAGKIDDRYQRNVVPLEEVQPPDVPETQIEVGLGAGWVSVEDIQQFSNDMVGTSGNSLPNLAYIAHNGSWKVGTPQPSAREAMVRGPSAQRFATNRFAFWKVLERALNRSPIKIYDRDSDGSTHFNPQASGEAEAAKQRLNLAFKEWIWEDEERRIRLHRHYNDNFNTNIPTKWNGDHLTFPGMNPRFNLFKHNRDAIWRIIRQQRLILAHEVGTGKTAIMGGAAMELKRLGLYNKPGIVVPKQLIGQITRELRELYPGARILSTGEEGAASFEAPKRKRAVTAMATGDWDMVVMTDKQLDFLQMRPEYAERFVAQELREVDEAIAAEMASGAREESPRVKDLASQRQRIRESWNTLINQSRSDDAIFFEETGIDFLFVDESHGYKNLPIATAHQVKGLPTNSTNQKTRKLLMKSRWLMELNNGKGLVLSTGTPVSNSLAEVFNLMKYIQPEQLRQRNISSFDGWMATFGDIENRMEFTHTGQVKDVTSFSGFNNLTELRAINGDDLSVFRFGEGQQKDITRPKRVDRTIEVDETPLGELYRYFIWYRVMRLPTGPPRMGQDGHLLLNQDGSRGAVDIRLVMPGKEDEPGSKLNQLVKTVLRVKDEHPGKTQFIFYDEMINDTPWGFNAYDDIIGKLVAGGIPKEAIADARKWGNDTREEKEKKAEDIARLNRGDTLVVIGSTSNLGTGTNAQQRAIAAHHLDAPYKPSQIEQRNGRVWRTGNVAVEEGVPVEIYTYVTTRTTDAFRWTLLDRKATGINAWLSGDLNSRTLQEKDVELQTPAEIMAIASGDPRLIEAIQLRDDVDQMGREREFHRQAGFNSRTQIQQAKTRIKDTKFSRKRWLDTKAFVAKTADDEFAVTIDGKRIEGTKEGAIALRKKSAELVDDENFVFTEPRVIGEFRGMQIQAIGRSRFTGDGKQHWVELSLRITPEMVESMPTPISEAFKIGENDTGTINSINAAAKRFQDPWVPFDETIASLERSIKREEGIGDKPYQREEEFAKKKTRLDELRGVLTSSADMTDPDQLPITPEQRATLDEWYGERIGRIGQRARDADDRAASQEDIGVTYWTWEDGTFVPQPKAKGIAIEGAEVMDLFVFKHPSRGWGVYEGSSGQRIGSAAKTRKSAIASATSLLTKFNSDEQIGIVNDGIDRVGKSPRAEITEGTEEQPRDPLDENLHTLQAGPTPWALVANMKRILTAQRGEAAVEKATVQPKAADPEVERRMAEADGIKKPAFLEKVKYHGAEMWKLRKHFPELDRVRDAPLIDILNKFEGVHHSSAILAVNHVVSIIGTFGPKRQRLHSRILALRDILREIDAKDSLYESKPVPFYDDPGPTARALVVEDLKTFEAAANNTPGINEMLDKRQRLARPLVERLVELDLLPSGALENVDKYYHRQVLKYYNGEQEKGDSFLPQDVRARKRGFQKARTGGTDFNLRFAEAEFEWVRHAYEQIQTAEYLNRIEQLTNVRRDLQNQASSLNNEQMVELEGEQWSLDYRRRKAIAHHELAKMAMNGTLGNPYGRWDGLIDDLKDTYVTWLDDTAGMDKDELKENPFRFQHPNWFQFLSDLDRSSANGALQARSFYKAMQDQERFVRDSLGNNYSTWQSLRNRDEQVEWQPEEGNVLYRTYSIEERMVRDLLEGNGMFEASMVKEVLALGGRKEVWVVPKRVGKTLDKIRLRQDGEIDRYFQMPTRFWRVWTLFNPFKFGRYRFNNQTGDFDVAFAADPKIFFHIPSAMRQLFRFIHNRSSPKEQDRIEMWIQDRVVNSGVSILEIPSINQTETMRLISGDRRGPFKWYWDMVTKWNNYMENITRLAAAERAMKRLERGDEFTWASSKPEIEALRKEVAAGRKPMHELAGKLARELIGDYGNRSVAGQWIRKHTHPYWSWMELNMPRYVRLLANAHAEEKAGGGRMSTALVRLGIAGTAKTAMMILKVHLLLAMIKVMMKILWPEEDEALHRGRRQQHWITGHNPDGSIRSLRVQGALGDAYEWFSLTDIDDDVFDLLRGKSTITDVGFESLTAPFERFTQAALPVVRNVGESAIGWRLNWPNMLEEGLPAKIAVRPVNNRMAHLASFWSVRWIYDHVTGKPQPESIRSSPWDQLLFYRTDPGEASYYYIKERIRRWQRKHDIQVGGGRRFEHSQALWYWKQAVKWGDEKAAKHWILEYKKLGGTYKGAAKSIEMTAPFGMLSRKHKEAFIATLDKKDREAAQTAIDWYKHSLSAK